VAACPARRERTISSSARGAPPQAPHGPLQAVVRGTAALPRRPQALLALTHRAHARNSGVEQSQALIEATSADCSRRASGATRAAAAANNHCFQSVKYRTAGPAPKLLNRQPRKRRDLSSSAYPCAGATLGTSAFLPNSPSNAALERPRGSVSTATRAHNLFQRPRRAPTSASRPAPSSC
jgi:hypothetical protein